MGLKTVWNKTRTRRKILPETWVRTGTGTFLSQSLIGEELEINIRHIPLYCLRLQCPAV